MQRSEIIEKVISLLCIIMDLDENEIDLDSSLIDDIGVESIDFIDIATKLEETFNIEIAEGELWNFSDNILDEGLIEDGKITKKGVKMLQKKSEL